LNTIVIALGGNALQESGQPATAENQLAVIEKTAASIVPLAQEGMLAIVHGNGPQVGRLVLQNEYAAAITPAMPFDVCGAMSQGLIGYHLQQALTAALRASGQCTLAVTVLTQVVVDRRDPGFQHPSKPIGLFYSREEAERIMAEKGYVMKEDAGRGYRRVVASPDPLEIVELEIIRTLLASGYVPICAGGGGIPVLRDEAGLLTGVEAVIDKDLAAEKLAEDLDAHTLLILTAVEQVSLHYGTSRQTDLRRANAAQVESFIAAGHFAPGSMLPKMQAALRFVKNAPHRRAIITSLGKAAQALRGQAGTEIIA